MDDSYKTILKNSQGLYKDKGSKFISYAYPVQTEDEIKSILHILKKEHHGARHHCYAWRIGTEEIRYRANDDGEPSSTAGKPILGQLLSFEVTNIMVVVVRYFGGTLLGVSGLINAYKNATINALQNAKIIEKIIETTYCIEFTYNELNKVMLVLKNNNIQNPKTDFAEKCKIIFSIRNSEANRIEEVFNDFYGVKIDKITP